MWEEEAKIKLEKTTKKSRNEKCIEEIIARWGFPPSSPFSALRRES